METPKNINVSDSIVRINLDKLKKYERNNKKHPQEQIDKIKRSIEAFGFRNPILVDKDYNIIAGHGRVTAAKQLGMSQAPCIIIDNLTPEDIRAFRIMDNRSAQSEWDLDSLKLEFTALDEADFDLDLTGFDFDEISMYMKDKDETYNPKNKEINIDTFGDDLNIVCPKCGFEFKYEP